MPRNESTKAQRQGARKKMLAEMESRLRSGIEPELPKPKPTEEDKWAEWMHKPIYIDTEILDDEAYQSTSSDARLMWYALGNAASMFYHLPSPVNDGKIYLTPVLVSIGDLSKYGPLYTPKEMHKAVGELIEVGLIAVDWDDRQRLEFPKYLKLEQPEEYVPASRA